MKSKKAKALGLFLLIIILGVLTPQNHHLFWEVSSVEAGVRERTTGSNWGLKFWANGTPHYGTSFRGSNGADPNYTGSGGNAATAPYSGGIKAWNWWGNELGTLLTPKSWVCFPLFNCGADRTNPQKYDAIVTR